MGYGWSHEKIPFHDEKCYLVPLPKPRSLKRYLKNPIDNVSVKRGFIYKYIPGNWKKISKKIVDQIKNEVLVDGYLPAGTKLFHGSRHCPFFYEQRKKKNEVTFFGIDPLISIWYADEINGDYLYVFELKKDLKIDVLSSDEEHPSKKTKKSYIKPQYIYRGFESNDYIAEIGIEVMFNYFEHKEKLKLLKIFKIDRELTRKNVRKTKDEWDAREAIVSEVKIRK